MLLAVSLESTQPDASITTATGGYHSSRIMGNRGQVGRGAHRHSCTRHLQNNFKEEEHILEMRSLVDKIMIQVSDETTMPH